ARSVASTQTPHDEQPRASGSLSSWRPGTSTHPTRTRSNSSAAWGVSSLLDCGNSSTLEPLALRFPTPRQVDVTLVYARVCRLGWRVRHGRSGRRERSWPDLAGVDDSRRSHLLRHTPITQPGDPMRIVQVERSLPAQRGVAITRDGTRSGMRQTMGSYARYPDIQE